MDILPDEYCGDEKMSGYLKKVNSKLTICEVYGLFYGCFAAPNLVMPSMFYPLIFGEEGASFESDGEANEIISNLMFLWNVLAKWNPESDPFIFPYIKYPETISGIVQRSKDNYSLIAYFIKGLDLGGTRENDFSEEGINALKSLSEVQVFFDKYGELLNKEGDSNMSETIKLIHSLENITGDCIARISIDLTQARLQVLEKMRKSYDAKNKASQAKSTKIPRNVSCPCGSGKKYKKCCGLIH